MPFRRQQRQTVEEILRAAEEAAAELGVEEYLIVVRRGRALVTISEPDELRQGDEYVGIVTDAKGGA